MELRNYFAARKVPETAIKELLCEHITNLTAQNLINIYMRVPRQSDACLQKPDMPEPASSSQKTEKGGTLAEKSK